jgi:diaminopimelate decarboxylase
VVTVKSGEPTFVAVDGGMADNFEASTYVGTRFEATMVERVGGGDFVELVGRQCESGDRLASGIRLNQPAPGDLVAMPMTGAYTHTLVNNYNGALRPAVVFCRDGTATAVVRRDTYDDLLARELPWP